MIINTTERFGMGFDTSKSVQMKFQRFNGVFLALLGDRRVWGRG
jgi:hypothetical protein